MLLGKQAKVEIFRKCHMKMLFFYKLASRASWAVTEYIMHPWSTPSLRLSCKPQLHPTPRLQSQHLSLLLCFQSSHVTHGFFLFSLSAVSLSRSSICSCVLVSVALEDACMFKGSSLWPPRVNSMPFLYSVLCQTIPKIPSRFANNLFCYLHMSCHRQTHPGVHFVDVDVSILV